MIHSQACTINSAAYALIARPRIIGMMPDQTGVRIFTFPLSLLRVMLPMISPVNTGTCNPPY
ncbi:hypothetical protein D3C80_2209300 [compost metagenome]